MATGCAVSIRFGGDCTGCFIYRTHQFYFCQVSFDFTMAVLQLSSWPFSRSWSIREPRSVNFEKILSCSKSDLIIDFGLPAQAKEKIIRGQSCLPSYWPLLIEDQSIIAKTTCKLFSSVIPGVSIIAQFVLACLPFLNNCLLRVFEPRSNIFVLTFGFKEPLLPDEVPTGTLDGDGPLLTADISHSARCWGQRGWLYPRWKIRWIFCWKRR